MAATIPLTAGTDTARCWMSRRATSDRGRSAKTGRMQVQVRCSPTAVEFSQLPLVRLGVLVGLARLRALPPIWKAPHHSVGVTPTSGVLLDARQDRPVAKPVATTSIVHQEGDRTPPDGEALSTPTQSG